MSIEQEVLVFTSYFPVFPPEYYHNDEHVIDCQYQYFGISACLIMRASLQNRHTFAYLRIRCFFTFERHSIRLQQ